MLPLTQWQWVESSSGIVYDHFTISQSADWASQPWVRQLLSFSSPVIMTAHWLLKVTELSAP